MYTSITYIFKCNINIRIKEVDKLVRMLLLITTSSRERPATSIWSLKTLKQFANNTSNNTKTPLGNRLVHWRLLNYSLNERFQITVNIRGTSVWNLSYRMLYLINWIQQKRLRFICFIWQCHKSPSNWYFLVSGNIRPDGQIEHMKCYTLTQRCPLRAWFSDIRVMHWPVLS